MRSEWLSALTGADVWLKLEIVQGTGSFKLRGAANAIARLREMLAPHKAKRFNVGAFKEWTGISRKYAIPLLEFLDREHVTRREGDERLVL